MKIRGVILFAVLPSLFLLALAFAVDRPVARLMTHNDPAVIALCRFISWFGQGGVILYPTGLILLCAVAAQKLRPNLPRWLGPVIARVAIVFAVVAVAGLINDLLKIVFGRARPALWLAGDESGFGFFRVGARFASFPSGHTATSVAAALVFGALLPRWRWPFLAAASLIALSRIGVGAHYPSDVVGGAIIGGLVAAALIRQARIRGWMQASAIQESGTGER